MAKSSFWQNRREGASLRLRSTARRDAVAGTVYLLMLLVFAVMPALVGRRKSAH
jgi:hypothetical protein